MLGGPPHFRARKLKFNDFSDILVTISRRFPDVFICVHTFFIIITIFCIPFFLGAVIVSRDRESSVSRTSFFFHEYIFSFSCCKKQHQIYTVFFFFFLAPKFKENIQERRKPGNLSKRHIDIFKRKFL